MNVTGSFSPTTARPMGLIPAAVFIAIPLLAVAGAMHPVSLLMLIAAAIGGILLWRSTDWATYVVLFVVYSNAAVVAVKYHGVPSIAANGVIGLLGIPLGAWLVLRKEPLVLGSCFPWILGLAAVQFVGAICARQPELAWEDLNTFLTEGLLLYLLVVNVVRTPQALRGATWALLLAGCLLGGVPLFQQLTGTFENDYGGFAQTGDEPGFDTGTGDDPQLRLSGPIGEKNRYAQIMLMLVPLALYRLRDEHSNIGRVCALATLLFALAGTYLAFSRSSILAAGMVVALAAWWGHVNRKSVVVLFALSVAGLLMTPQYRARLSSLVDLRELIVAGKHSDTDGALKGRATEMGAAALVFVDHPLVGVGPGQFRYYSRHYGERIGLRALAPQRQAHCLPLDVAAENGILGLACLCAVFATACRGLLRRVNESIGERELQGLAAGYLYMIAIYAATGLFLHFAFIRYFWVMIGLASAAALITSTNTTRLTQELTPEGPT